MTVTVICAGAACIVLVIATFLCCALFKARLRLAEAEAQRKSQEEINRAKADELYAQRESLKAEFAQLAADLLGERQAALTKANESSVRSLFSDLKAKLDKYERDVAESARSNTNLGVEMRTHIGSLQRFADEARSFTAALIGGNKIQGNQGEEILYPTFGNNLRKFLYRPLDETSRGELSQEVKRAVEENEKRVIIDSLGIDTAADDEQHSTIHLRLNYHVIGAKGFGQITDTITITSNNGSVSKKSK